MQSMHDGNSFFHGFFLKKDFTMTYYIEWLGVQRQENKPIKDYGESFASFDKMHKTKHTWIWKCGETITNDAIITLLWGCFML